MSKHKTLYDKLNDEFKEEIIKEFLRKHTITQIIAIGFFEPEKARKISDKLQKIGFTVICFRRLY